MTPLAPISSAEAFELAPALLAAAVAGVVAGRAAWRAAFAFGAPGACYALVAFFALTVGLVLAALLLDGVAPPAPLVLLALACPLLWLAVRAATRSAADAPDPPMPRPVFASRRAGRQG